MKRFSFIFIILLFLFILCSCGSSATEASVPVSDTDPDIKETDGIKPAFNDDPDAITAASESVVMISVYDANGDLLATGSGFPMFEEGFFVTNFHVIAGGTSFTANTESEMYFIFDSVVAVDQVRDIAILRTNAKTGLGVLEAGDTSSLKKGEKVVAIGSPLGLINTVSEGMYSNVREEDGVNYLQFTAPISHGSSGGALFNNSGEVIGITSASYIEGQNLNLAIPIEDVIDVWENKSSYPAIMETVVETDTVASSPSQITIDEYFVNNSKYTGLKVLIEGYVSSKYHEIYSDNSGGYYKISLVVDPKYIVGNDLTFQSTITPTYKQTRWVEEEKNIGNARYGIILNASDIYYDVSPGDHIVIQCIAWEKGSSMVYETLYGDFYASHFVTNVSLVDFLNN